MKLEDLQVYQIAMDLAEQIWNIVQPWDYFAKDTIGKQLVCSSDSMAANLSEGFGRIFIKRTDNFAITVGARFMKLKHGLQKLKIVI